MQFSASPRPAVLASIEVLKINMMQVRPKISDALMDSRIRRSETIDEEWLQRRKGTQFPVGDEV